jgi:signal transduction histidine kinase
MGPRRRVYLALAVAAAAGFLGKWVFASGHRTFGCSSAPARSLHLCGGFQGYRPLARWLIASLLILLALVLGALLARWTLRPVRSLTSTVSRLGPQNLGERVPVGDVVDETTALTVQLNRMMDRLAAGYEGQRSFAANASHELRTPLAVQRALIEVGMAAPLTAEQLELLTRQLLDTNERNERLIEGLLVLSESERGLVGAAPQRLDEITGCVLDRHLELAQQADVVIRRELQPTTVFGEGVLLERLVTNLVQNAIKYNHPGGCIAVTVANEPALRVVNSGPSVPAEDVPALFEPFRRLLGVRTDHGGGSGLGLTIVRSIAAAHGGSVTAAPGPEGGLSVEVSLPGDGARSAQFI